MGDGDVSIKRTNAGQVEKVITLSSKIAKDLTAPSNHKLLIELSGAGAAIEIAEGSNSHVVLRGSSEQVHRAARLVGRVIVHCSFGCNVEKIRRLLKPPDIQTVLCRLA